MTSTPSLDARVQSICAFLQRHDLTLKPSYLDYSTQALERLKHEWSSKEIRENYHTDPDRVDRAMQWMDLDQFKAEHVKTPPTFEQTLFFDSLADLLCNGGLHDWLKRLRTPKDFKWQVAFTPNTSDLVGWSDVEVFPRLSDALDFLFSRIVEIDPIDLDPLSWDEICDSSLPIIKRAEMENRVLRLFDDSDICFATIREIQFASVDANRHKAAIKACESSSPLSTLGRAKYRRIEGLLAPLEHKQETDQADYSLALADFSPKAVANVMHAFLSDACSERIPKHLALEATALVCGYVSWNHLTGTYNQAMAQTSSLVPVYLTTKRGDEEEAQSSAQYELQSDYASALVRLGKLMLKQPPRLPARGIRTSTGHLHLSADLTDGTTVDIWPCGTWRYRPHRPLDQWVVYGLAEAIETGADPDGQLTDDLLDDLTSRGTLASYRLLSHLREEEAESQMNEEAAEC